MIGAVWSCQAAIPDHPGLGPWAPQNCDMFFDFVERNVRYCQQDGPRWQTDGSTASTPPVVSFPFKCKMSIPLVVFSRIDRSMAPSTITWGNLGARCARRQKLSHVRPVIATRGCLKPYFLRSRGGLVISAVTCRPISPTSAEMWWIKLASNRAQSGHFLLPIGARKLF